MSMGDGLLERVKLLILWDLRLLLRAILVKSYPLRATEVPFLCGEFRQIIPVNPSK
jgi:hypothetical protein